MDNALCTRLPFCPNQPSYTITCQATPGDIVGYCCQPAACPGGGGGPLPTPTPVPTYPDFTVTQVDARTSTGANPSAGYFITGQDIAIRATINNIGDEWTCCWAGHAVFKDSTAYNNGTPTMQFSSGANFPITSIDYMSWTGGSNYTTFNNQTFTQNEADTYTLRVYADYGNNLAEHSDANNVGSTTYDVYAHLYGSVCWSQNEDAQCDTGEPMVAGVRISATRNGVSIGSHTTNSNGDYDFDYRAGGDYALTFSSNSWRTVNTNPRTTTLGPNTRIRFAAIPTYDLSGYIFIDDNRDGTKDPTETTGYSGATVTLTGPAGEGGTTTTDATGRYSFPNKKRGNYTVTLTVPVDYKAYPNNDNTRTITIPLNSTQNGWTADIGINRVYTIAGKIYVDADKSSSSMSSGDFNSAKDMPLASVVVHAVPQGTQQSRSDRSDANGDFLITAIEPGDFLLTADPGTDYVSLPTYPRPLTITAGDAHQRDLKFFGKYQISGNVFVDSDDSQRKNGSETNFAASPGILMSNYPGGAPNPLITNNPDGSYTLTGLISGQYTVRYPSLPTGYIMNHPRNGPPASFIAPVGSSCAEATPSPGGNCNNNNLENLNFAIKRGLPWWQAYGLDVRFDTGISNPVPPSPDASCTGAYAMLPGSSSTPGVAFTGAAPANFWQGNVSSNGWLVGGAAYPETFVPSNGTLIQTSYGYLQSIMKQSNITPTNLTTVCSNLNNCTLPGGLSNGIYQANSSVTLNNFTASANRDIIILVNGDLTLKGTLSVPTTSTVFYSVSGSITVDPSLGRTAACPGPVIGSGNLEGFFSADQNFSVPSGSSTNPATADCSASPSPIPDKQLNVQGAIVVNAGGSGGNFINSRDLCTDNINFPSFTIRERPDMILNAPEFLRVPNFIWQEVAP